MMNERPRDKSGEYLVSEVRPRKGESFESFLRRFSKRVQHSGKLIQAKKIRHFKSPKSKGQQRVAALRREYLRQHREYLIKTGQATEDDFKKKTTRRA